MVRPGNAVQTFQPALPYRQLGSPLIRLTGDEFCSSPETSLYLLENLNSAISGTALTNNAAATFALDTDYGNTVVTLNGSTQYLFLPTEASVQVGTGSFIPSIWFKTSTTGALQMIYSYGSHVAGKAYWEARINSANTLAFEIWDGTTTNTVTDTIANRWQDGKWHCVTTLVDKTTNNIYFQCDGTNIGTVAVTATNTLTIAGENLYFGVRKNSGGTNDSYFNGQLANFHLIKAADYNSIGVLNQGIREPVMSGTWTTTTNTNYRLDNIFYNSSVASGDYTYALINTEAGLYEIQWVYASFNDRGIGQLLIDNNVKITQDMYSSSITYNLITKAYKVPLTEGTHLVKIFTNTKNGSSFAYTIPSNFINFIKRQGHEEGGTDNFLLFGDEINERSVNTWNFLTLNGGIYFTLFENNGSPANGDYTEGTLFIKGGLYRIDCTFNTNTDRAEVDLWFGNVQVLSQYDTNQGTSSNITKSVLVRLQQGRQNVRMAVNGKTGTTYLIVPQFIRGVRVSD